MSMSTVVAARFWFLLATPIILAAGVYKVPDLAGHLGDGIRGQALVGAIAAGVATSLDHGPILVDDTTGRCSSRSSRSIASMTQKPSPAKSAACALGTFAQAHS